MKLINEIIEFALQHDMLTEEHKRKLQHDGFYTFFHEDAECRSPYDYDYDYDHMRDYDQDAYSLEDDEFERTYYGDFYHPGKRCGRRHHGGGRKTHKTAKTELEIPDLEQRVRASFKKWDKSLKPLVLTVSFLTNHGMNDQGRNLTTWQNASNWLYEVNGQRLLDAVSQLEVAQMLKFTQLCSLLPWRNFWELLVEPIRQCKGECVTTFKELIRGTNEPLSESAETMIENDLFAQVYRLATGWSKIC
ncbi:MAG: hypothetical protein IJF84_10070 [Thermoguttaceae bacterium]|nr:hypothetical protein [Thermoguttaceae bacterium]